MRIALVSTPFVAVPPRGYGGTELIVHELQRGLVLAGHDVTLFATGDSEGRDVRYLVDRPVWPPDPAVEDEHARFAAAEIRRGAFDLVHAHAASFLSHARLLDPPVVYTVHHSRDDELTSLYRQNPSARYVAISHRQAALDPGLTSAVVHHGLDPERHPFGAGEGGYALFIGRLSWCKAPDLAVAAAREAGSELVVAGSVHDEPQDPPGWARHIDAALAGPGIRRVGSVAGPRKMSLIGRAAALLMPLRWEEPFGLVMIEAMLCGTPVVAFRRGSAPEVVEQGVTGFLVDDVAGMASALRRVREIDRSECRRRARARFAASRMLRDYLRVYHEALATRGLRRPEAEGSSYAAH